MHTYDLHLHKWYPCEELYSRLYLNGTMFKLWAWFVSWPQSSNWAIHSPQKQNLVNGFQYHYCVAELSLLLLLEVFFFISLIFLPNLFQGQAFVTLNRLITVFQNMYFLCFFAKDNLLLTLKPYETFRNISH